MTATPEDSRMVKNKAGDTALDITRDGLREVSRKGNVAARSGTGGQFHTA